MTVQQNYSGKRTAEIVGITYRHLDYWARTDLVKPSASPAAGSGSRRAYSYSDLLELKVVKTLLDAGLRFESVRDVFSFLKEQLGEEVTSAVTEENGTYKLIGLLAGTYDIEVSAIGYVDGQVADVVVEIELETTGVDVALATEVAPAP